ncbi:hypothetical protein DFJ73DRAFT_797642 [Zopfochytrium polystomum]|nr:hypothetical protein DFJ73DRAFT_797642 [Zopfochytrium polystomum]
MPTTRTPTRRRRTRGRPLSLASLLFLAPRRSSRTPPSAAALLVLAASVASTSVRVASAACANPRAVPEWDQLAAAEKQAFVDAIKALESRSIQGKSAGFSSLSFFDFVQRHTDDAPYVHADALFFPYHRALLHAFDVALQSVGWTKGVPYFDWSGRSQTWASSDVFTYLGPLVGASPYSCVTSPPFKVSPYPESGPSKFRVVADGSDATCLRRAGTASSAMVDATVLRNIFASATNFVDFQGDDTTNYHAYGHFNVGGSGGDMSNPMHHAMVDKIWWKWQQICPQYKTDYEGHLQPSTSSRQATQADTLYAFPYKVSDMLDTTAGDLCYTYTKSAGDVDFSPRNCPDGSAANANPWAAGSSNNNNTPAPATTSTSSSQAAAPSSSAAAPSPSPTTTAAAPAQSSAPTQPVPSSTAVTTTTNGQPAQTSASTAQPSASSAASTTALITTTAGGSGGGSSNNNSTALTVDLLGTAPYWFQDVVYIVALKSSSSTSAAAAAKARRHLLPHQTHSRSPPPSTPTTYDLVAAPATTRKQAVAGAAAGADADSALASSAAAAAGAVVVRVGSRTFTLPAGYQPVRVYPKRVLAWTTAAVAAVTDPDALPAGPPLVVYEDEDPDDPDSPTAVACAGIDPEAASEAAAASASASASEAATPLRPPPMLPDDVLAAWGLGRNQHRRAYCRIVRALAACGDDPACVSPSTASGSA